MDDRAGASRGGDRFAAAAGEDAGERQVHTRPDGRFDPVTFERDELARIGMPREIALRHRLPHAGPGTGDGVTSEINHGMKRILTTERLCAFSGQGAP